MALPTAGNASRVLMYMKTTAVKRSKNWLWILRNNVRQTDKTMALKNIQKRVRAVSNMFDFFHEFDIILNDHKSKAALWFCFSVKYYMLATYN